MKFHIFFFVECCFRKTHKFMFRERTHIQIYDVDYETPLSSISSRRRQECGEKVERRGNKKQKSQQPSSLVWQASEASIENIPRRVLFRKHPPKKNTARAIRRLFMVRRKMCTVNWTRTSARVFILCDFSPPALINNINQSEIPESVSISFRWVARSPPRAGASLFIHRCQVRFHQFVVRSPLQQRESIQNK